VARQSSELEAADDDVEESPAGFEPESPLPPDPDSPDADSPEPDSPEPELELELELDPALAFVRVLLADDRSFFAQPDPLKWIAGVDIARRIVPSWPQFGQTCGPVALIPWITSMRCLQFEQT
jgi:hypothetical protein